MPKRLTQRFKFQLLQLVVSGVTKLHPAKTHVIQFVLRVEVNFGQMSRVLAYIIYYNFTY